MQGLPPTDPTINGKRRPWSRGWTIAIGVFVVAGGIVALVLTPALGPFDGVAGSAYLLYLIVPPIALVLVGRGFVIKGLRQKKEQS